MERYFLCSVVFFKICLVTGLYEDQIGKFDWHQKHIGYAKHIIFEQNSLGNRRILMTTEENVVASLNAKNGELGWRQVFEKGKKGSISNLYKKGLSVVLISGSGSRYIRCFNFDSGFLLWEILLPSTDVSFAAIERYGNDIVVVANKVLMSIHPETGEVHWRTEILHGGPLAVDGDRIKVVSMLDGAVSIQSLTNGEASPEAVTVSAGWLKSSSYCRLVANSHVLCIDEQKLFALSLDRPDNFKAVPCPIIPTSIRAHASVDDTTYVSVHDGREVMLYSVSNEAISIFKNFKQVAVYDVVTLENEIFMLTISSPENEALAVTVYNIKTGEKISKLGFSCHFPKHHGNPVKMFALIFKKKDGGLAVRVLVHSQDAALVLLQSSGRASWTREEALSAIVGVQMVDLPISKSMSKLSKSNTLGSKDIFTLLVDRITSQLDQLWMLLQKLQSSSYASSAAAADGLTRDEFNLHKMVVVVTKYGKLFGLDSFTGRVVWSRLVAGLHPFERLGRLRLPLLLQRSSSHFPLDPLCTVVGRDAGGARTLVHSFHPVTGRPAFGEHVAVFDFALKLLHLVAHKSADEFVQPIVMLDHQLKLHVYPEDLRSFVQSESDWQYLYGVDVDQSSMTGYGILPDLRVQQLWSVNLQRDSQTVIAVAGKLSEPVHSQGIVLSDRSVLYKYLNRNLVAVATQSQHEGNTLTIYLVDGITGRIVFHCQHKKARGPVYLVHSENWLVYNYWSEKMRRTELSVLELFEGKEQLNGTAFSSLQPPRRLFVKRQAYIFAARPTTMISTVTDKGITHKHVLMATESGAIIEIPRMMLDPRRPELLNLENSREEGVIPYMPELPKPYEAFINYNLSTQRVHGMFASPAGLESTSLVIAYGLDIFYTRVQPSKMFDVLKEDFDYFFISSVVFGMITVSLISQKLAARKALNRSWS